MECRITAAAYPIDHMERRMTFARERAALAWCHEKTKNTVMDFNLAEAFAQILVHDMYAPHLGCATTGELIEELRARVDLSYSTIPQPGPPKDEE